jgi:hypothetical protein
MARKRRTEVVAGYWQDYIQTHEEYQLSPRVVLTRGDRFKVKGETGDFLFDQYVTNEQTGAEWVDCYSKEKKRRSFRPERITKRVKSTR